jgi:hypothetical protein
MDKQLHKNIRGRNAFLSWEAITAISTALTTVVLALSGIFIAFQAKELKKSASAEAFSTISRLLDENEVRMARCTLITISKKFCSWTQPEKDAAEFVCSRFGSVGIMVRNKLVFEEMIIEEWGYSIIKCYEKAQPMISEYRNPSGNEYRENNYRADFEWLYCEAKKIKPSLTY